MRLACIRMLQGHLSRWPFAFLRSVYKQSVGRYRASRLGVGYFWIGVGSGGGEFGAGRTHQKLKP